MPSADAYVQNASRHGHWHDRLRAAQAVYLILDEQTGQRYIGSATGHDGLLGRCLDYAKTSGHGNNKELIELLQKRPDAASDLSFPILRVFDRQAPRDQVLNAEASLKDHLEARKHGLCCN